MAAEKQTLHGHPEMSYDTSNRQHVHGVASPTLNRSPIPRVQTPRKIMGGGGAVSACDEAEARKRIDALTAEIRAGAKTLDQIKPENDSPKLQQKAMVLRAVLRVACTELNFLIRQIKRNDFPEKTRSDGVEMDIYESPTSRELWGNQNCGWPLPRRLTHEAQQAIADGSLIHVNNEWVRADALNVSADGLVQRTIFDPANRPIHEFELAPGETRKRWMDAYRAPRFEVVRFIRPVDANDVASRVRAEQRYRATGSIA